MNCPKCGNSTSVEDTRGSEYGVRRRRMCQNPSCNLRFSTEEITDAKIEWFKAAESWFKGLANLQATY